MYVAKDKKKNGKTFYRYKYRDHLGQLRTVPLKQYSHLDNENYEVMIANMKYFEAKYDSLVMEKEERESWHDKYYDFNSLLEIYVERMKKKSPRSWESKVAFFKYYVLPFFLNEKSAINLEEWKKHFPQFINYLADVKQVRNGRAKGGKNLSINSQNHCITELNNFLTIMSFNSKCDAQPKCPQIKEMSDDSLMSLDDVFDDKEIAQLSKFLEKENQIAADLFTVMIHSGARISEALAWGPNNISQGPVPNDQLDKMFKSAFGPYKLYIHFNRQIDKDGLIDEEEDVKYAPLKGKKSIHPRYTRYAPVYNKKAEEALLRQLKNVKEQIKIKKYGEDRNNYLLFGRDISQSILYSLMKKFYAKNTKFKSKSPHSTRHTFCTYCASKDITKALGKVIAGHSSDKIHARYSHLAQQIYSEKSRKGKDILDLV